MRNQVILAVFFALITIPVHGQNDTLRVPGNLYLDFTNINFVRDDEYSNPVIEGYTLIGYFIQPALVYSPSEKVTLKLGAHLLSYSGTNKFSLAKPVFSTTLHFNDHISLIAGTLAGSDSHRMSDPHFNKERLYNAYSEDGLQLRIHDVHFFSDTWLSWENFIFKGDTDREIFTAGESFRYTTGRIADLFRLEIPVQAEFKHYGGQISNYPQHVETYFNTAAGARIVYDPDDENDYRLGLDGMLFSGKCLTQNAPSGIKSGYGEWYRIFLNYKFAGIEAGYWSSHNFYAPNGDFIFGSVSDHLPGVVIPDRRIITCSADIKTYPLKNLEFYFGFDSYYDTDLRKFDYALTLHLRFDELFRIATLKKR